VSIQTFAGVILEYIPKPVVNSHFVPRPSYWRTHCWDCDDSQLIKRSWSRPTRRRGTADRRRRLYATV
jgi:hypothetical protein